MSDVRQAVIAYNIGVGAAGGTIAPSLFNVRGREKVSFSPLHFGRQKYVLSHIFDCKRCLASCVTERKISRASGYLRNFVAKKKCFNFLAFYSEMLVYTEIKT